MSRQRKIHGEDYDFCPQTYIFPEDYKKFMNERELEPNSTLYIMKPIASSRGRGIKVYSNQMHIPKKRLAIKQLPFS